jgi:hypothetical protein
MTLTTLVAFIQMGLQGGWKNSLRQLRGLRLQALDGILNDGRRSVSPHFAETCEGEMQARDILEIHLTRFRWLEF